ncbi:hypothetical protein KP509_14G061100 [Ceratopteris richardii]|uniref:Uncharacterized protein n=1 Tax=Ceratopteris richardii TaxID=49495 RepID=A0A8T2TCC8_CERRI|nr:hypothetical protein KP509_14G061100 [Ceratopteris richardii]
MVIADAPARAIVFFGDGLMEFVSPSHSHLHALAASGACGFLALRNLPSYMDNMSRSIFEMQQLLDVHDFGKAGIIETSSKNNVTTTALTPPSIAERFMGMKAAIITNSEPIANLGENLGFMLNNSKVGLHFSEPHVSNSVPQLASSAQVASELLELLGLGSQPLKESNNCELVLVHVTAGSGTDDAVARSCIDWIDSIVGEVKNLMQPGTKADDHLYLTLVFSYGVKAASDVSLNNLELHRQQVFDSLQTNLRVHCPQQSYKMKDGKLVIDGSSSNAGCPSDEWSYSKRSCLIA